MLLLLVVCLFSFTGAVSASGPGGFHDSSDRENCIKCHTRVPGEEGVSRQEASLRFKGEIDKICGQCHGDFEHEHPVTLVVSPTSEGTKFLPLDSEGKIVCTSCHDVIERIPVHKKKTITGKKLCLSCHVDSEIFAQIIWYPTFLKKGEQGRLEVKVVEFNLSSKKEYVGDTVLLYYYAKDIDTGNITFGTDVLYDNGTHGDRVEGDSIFTLTETAHMDKKVRRLVYTGWILNSKNKRSNTVTLAIEYGE